MEKMNCDIIRDLIPSYVDDICSEATKKCVESHVKDCSECREILKLCRDNTLTGENADQLTLDGFQKIKKRMQIQFISNIVLIVVICFSIQIFQQHTNELIIPYAILLILSMCVNLLININGRIQKKANKRDHLMGFLSLLISIGSASLFYYVTQKALIAGSEPIFFGLGPSLCGLFLDRLFLVAFLMQLAFFIYFLLGIHRLRKDLLPHSCLAVTEIFLISGYQAMLHRLDTPESFFALFFRLNTITVTSAALGILAAILFIKRKNKNHFSFWE